MRAMWLMLQSAQADEYVPILFLLADREATIMSGSVISIAGAQGQAFFNLSINSGFIEVVYFVLFFYLVLSWVIYDLSQLFVISFFVTSYALLTN